jgi:hypothetical protein
VASIIHGGFGITINTSFDRGEVAHMERHGTWINTGQLPYWSKEVKSF